MKRIALIIIVAVIAVAGIGISVTYGTFSMNAAGKTQTKSGKADIDLNMVSRNIPVKDFSVLDVAGNMTVIYTAGSKAAMTVSGPKYFLDNMVVEISGGTMKIGYTEEFYKRNSNRGFSWKDLLGNEKKEVRVTLSSSALKKVSASLSANFYTSNLNGIDAIELYASTSADIKVGSISASNLTAQASTSGDVKINTVQAGNSASVNAQTSGDVKIEVLVTDTLNAEASTSGDVKIKDLTADRVTASASTSGDVEMAGKADTVNLSASTSGDVKAGKLIARNATVSASTSGDVKYCARNTVNKTRGGIHNTYNE